MQWSYHISVTVNLRRQNRTEIAPSVSYQLSCVTQVIMTRLTGNHFYFRLICACQSGTRFRLIRAKWILCLRHSRFLQCSCLSVYRPLYYDRRRGPSLRLWWKFDASIKQCHIFHYQQFIDWPRFPIKWKQHSFCEFRVAFWHFYTAMSSENNIFTTCRASREASTIHRGFASLWLTCRSPML